MKVRSIRSKVLIAIAGITLLTAAAMAFVFYGRSSRMIEENYHNSAQSENQAAYGYRR